MKENKKEKKKDLKMTCKDSTTNPGPKLWNGDFKIL